MNHRTNSDRAKAVEMMRLFDTAMFVTQAPNGLPRARPMAIAAVDDDGEVWFVTTTESAKVDEVANETAVNVAMQSGAAFVSLSGHANLVHDRAKVRELWKYAWRVWFPDGPESADLVLVHVRPAVAELWDQRGVHGLRYAWKAVKAYVKGERIDERDEDGASHRKVQL